MGYWVDESLFKQLSKEDQAMVREQGVERDEPPAKASAPEEGMDKEPVEKKPEKFPMTMRYGDEDQYELEMKKDGGMQDMPPSEQNKITDFQDASERGKALLEAMFRSKGRKPKDQEEQE